MKRFNKRSEFYSVARNVINDFLDDNVDDDVINNYKYLSDFVSDNISVVIDDYLRYDDDTIAKVVAYNLRDIIDLTNDNDSAVELFYKVPIGDIYINVVRQYINNYAFDICEDWACDNLD